jgi:hypothetical protein
MREWLVEIEHILAAEWAATPEELTRAEVEQRLDGWQSRLQTHLQAGGEHPEEVRCLSYLLKVVTELRPYLTHCYQLPALPRTNNEMELLIRGIKTRYRRISGRKNWNAYLLRYGRCVAYYEYWAKQPDSLERRLRQVSPKAWRLVRQACRISQKQQLNRYHFRHRRQEYLAALEAQWEQACWM